MTRVTIFTDRELVRAMKIVKEERSQDRQPHKRLRNEVVDSIMERIDAQLGQENDPDFMAYLLEYTAT